MAEVPQLKTLDSGFLPPRRDMEGDLPGYKPKPRLFKEGEPKSPYVRDRFGCIWFYEPSWMDDMGDCLEPCWEAPPQPKLIVPVGIDLHKYSQALRSNRAEPAAPAAPAAPAPVQSAAVPQVKARRGK